MELRHLRHFLAVAEVLHFARAAKKLGMAQPPLSQSIMRLEKSLGTKLLDRSSRAVQLTSAGKALVPEARELLARADLAVCLVQRVARGELARVRIGFVPMSATLTLPRAVRAFQRDWPRVEVQLHERTSPVQADALRNGELDLGILVCDLIDSKGLQLRPIERYSYVAAVPATWPLAGRGSLQLADLASLPLVLFPQQLAPNFFTDFEGACRAAGFKPSIQQQVAQPYTMFTLVAEQLGIGIVQDTARHLKIDGISFVPIRDMPASLSHEVALAWVPRSVPPALRDMIAHIRKAARCSLRAPAKG
jgi:DNA-binding transcriptional LysR family regulator